MNNSALRAIVDELRQPISPDSKLTASIVASYMNKIADRLAALAAAQAAPVAWREWVEWRYSDEREHCKNPSLAEPVFASPVAQGWLPIREFLETCADFDGEMVNGNHLSRRAKELLALLPPPR
jgi:hypothetical protein